MFSFLAMMVMREEEAIRFSEYTLKTLKNISLKLRC